MTIDIEGFRRPEHDYGEKVGTRDESDDEGETQDPRLLLETRRENGVFSAINFPESESNEQKKSDDQRCQNMGRLP